MSSAKFDKDYYENGVAKKVSGYENFHYMPTRSYEEAIELTKIFSKEDKILDLGCAKGYLVHTLVQLGFNAWGEDISDYAISRCHQPIKGRIGKPKHAWLEYDSIICKDVLEHVPEDEILELLSKLKKRCKKALFVIPLGDNDKFRIREYEMDITHVTKKDEDWWINKLRSAGFSINQFSYKLGAIKKKWTSKYPYGNGFFIVE